MLGILFFERAECCILATFCIFGIIRCFYYKHIISLWSVRSVVTSQLFVIFGIIRCSYYKHILPLWSVRSVVTSQLFLYLCKDEFSFLLLWQITISKSEWRITSRSNPHVSAPQRCADFYYIIVAIVATTPRFRYVRTRCVE